MMSSKEQALVSPLHFVLTHTSTPLYVQLMQHIMQLIAQGQLLPEQRMPSSRVLAESLNVSRSTVVDAYDRLIAEDVLYTLPKRGIFIAQKPLLNRFSDEKQAQLTQSVKTKQLSSSLLLRFDSGADPDVFPKQAWLKSMKASWQSPDPAVLRDNYVTGFPLLKAALADYLFQLRGLHCAADQIIITAGNLDSLTLIHHALKNISPDNEWFIENPSYQPMQTFIQSHQQQVRYLPVDEAGCSLPDSKLSKTAVVVMTPNRQYPLGMNLESNRRQQWLNRLSQGQCWVIEDDYDNEFNYQRRDGLPLMQSDRSEHTFFIGSFSKILFRGLRLGYIVAPKALYAVVEQSRHRLGHSAALSMQPVVAEFMLSGDFAKHMNKMRRHYRRKRDYLITLFETHLHPWLSWQKPKGGMHVIAFLKPEVCVRTTQNTDYTDQCIADILLKQHILLSPLSSYYATNQPDTEIKQGFVCGFTSINEADMQVIVAALADVLKQFV